MLEAQNLEKTYRGSPVLHRVSLRLVPGRCLGVAGHNGSGKSTLLAILAQAIPPDAGEILYEGMPVLGNRDFLRRTVGYVPQQNALLPDLTVHQTLAFWQRAYGLPKTNLYAPGAPAALLGLDAIRGRRVSRLSGGMQKRLSLAIAMLHSPRILLLDEVLSALDRHHRTAFLAWLAAMRQQGTAVVYCSHEMAELAGLCDELLVLRQGRAVYHGPMDGLPDDDTALDAMLSPPE